MSAVETAHLFIRHSSSLLTLWKWKCSTPPNRCYWVKYLFVSIHAAQNPLPFPVSSNFLGVPNRTNCEALYSTCHKRDKPSRRRKYFHVGTDFLADLVESATSQRMPAQLVAPIVDRRASGRGGQSKGDFRTTAPPRLQRSQSWRGVGGKEGRGAAFSNLVKQHPMMLRIATS